MRRRISYDVIAHGEWTRPRLRSFRERFTELGLDTAEMEAHFAEILGAASSAGIFRAVKLEVGLE